MSFTRIYNILIHNIYVVKTKTEIFIVKTMYIYNKKSMFL